jgi:hypothetical protein
MDTSTSRAKLRETDLNTPTHTPPSKLKTYGFVIAIIVGIGGLAVGGAGVAGYFHVGTLSNMVQIDAIIMMAAGGGGGVILLIVGIVGTVKNRKAVHGSGSDPENLDIHSNTEMPSHYGHHPGRVGESQTEFIEKASTKTTQDTQRFGKAEWETYCGDVGKEPDLPGDINKILNSPCPFSGDANIKVKHTHTLVLIPATVDGEDLTLNKLEQLIKNPKKGNKTQYRWYENSEVKGEYGSAKVGRSHWVLMTIDVVPGSRNKPYNDQQELIKQYANEVYVVPDAIEAAVCIFMEFVALGVYLYGREPFTYTRCAQIVESTRGPAPVVFGAFGSDGLEVGYFDFDSDGCGVAALRRF